MLPPEAGAPGILALADRDRLRSLFAGARFSDPQIEEVACTFRFADANEYWEFLTFAAGAIAMILGRLDQDEFGRVREQVSERVASFRSAGGIALPGVSLVPRRRNASPIAFGRTPWRRQPTNAVYRACSCATVPVEVGRTRRCANQLTVVANPLRIE